MELYSKTFKSSELKVEMIPFIGIMIGMSSNSQHTTYAIVFLIFVIALQTTKS